MSKLSLPRRQARETPTTEATVAKMSVVSVI
jgi:hypothetical protein